jgi:UDP-2,3-diacylglucosamine pyrophosphatase LpxH
MLVIISDLHLGDGTTAESIPASAFYLFAKRLRQDAHFASINYGKYRPIEELDVILMGDILDPIHSTKWLFPPQGQEQYIDIGGEKHIRITEPKEAGYIRPWSDPSNDQFADKLEEVTRSIIDYNKEAFQVMRRLASGEFIGFDATDEKGNRVTGNPDKIPLKLRFHYMVGNHDWYYHLKGEKFDKIRQLIIDAMGLSNPPTPFPYDLRKLNPDLPWEADEYPEIEKLYQEYKIFGRHGDCYDSFNFDIERGRDQATLGDAFAMEVCNRFPEELRRRADLNIKIVDNLRHITNVRPALATPLWISGQITRLVSENALDGFSEKDIKRIWDDLCDQFLDLDFVRKKDQAFKFDIVDKMQTAIKISRIISLETLDNLIYRLQNRRMFGSRHSFSEYALREPSFIDDSARYIVYGHTHHHETIPLDYDEIGGNQIYFNSGTWHTYFDLARKDPTEKKFVPYKALTYIAFYKEHEHDDRRFETWSGAYA